MTVINIFDITGKFAMTADEGREVYSRIVNEFQKGETVLLDFKNIEQSISAFLNPAIGQLYGNYSQEQIRSLLKLQNMSPGDQHILRIVVENAKKTFSGDDKE